VRQTKAEKEYVAYTVVTQKYPRPSDDGDVNSGSTFHRVLSFADHHNAYLAKIPKGSLVYVEAAYEIREPDRDAEAGSYAATRQVFLRHENLRVIRSAQRSHSNQGDGESHEGTEGNFDTGRDDGRH